MTVRATLVYDADAVPPVSVTRLAAAMTLVELELPAIQDATGCFLQSDVTTTVSSTARRTIVFLLSVLATQQFNGNNPLPNNTKTRQWYVVTTTGGTANIGDLLFDNGSGTGTVTVITASTDNLIVVPGKFTGGTISFTQPGHYFTWSGAAWVAGALSPAGAFQSNFPPSGDQMAPFKNLYTHSLGAGLGSVISALPPSVT